MSRHYRDGEASEVQFLAKVQGLVFDRNLQQSTKYLLSQMILQKTTNHQHQSMPNGLGLGLTFHSPSLAYIDQLYPVPPR